MYTHSQSRRLQVPCRTLAKAFPQPLSGWIFHPARAFAWPAGATSHTAGQAAHGAAHAAWPRTSCHFPENQGCQQASGADIVQHQMPGRHTDAQADNGRFQREVIVFEFRPLLRWQKPSSTGPELRLALGAFKQGHSQAQLKLANLAAGGPRASRPVPQRQPSCSPIAQRPRSCARRSGVADGASVGELKTHGSFSKIAFFDWDLLPKYCSLQPSAVNAAIRSHDRSGNQSF